MHAVPTCAGPTTFGPGHIKNHWVDREPTAYKCRRSRLRRIIATAVTATCRLGIRRCLTPTTYGLRRASQKIMYQGRPKLAAHDWYGLLLACAGLCWQWLCGFASQPCTMHTTCCHARTQDLKKRGGSNAQVLHCFQDAAVACQFFLIATRRGAGVYGARRADMSRSFRCDAVYHITFIGRVARRRATESS